MLGHGVRGLHEAVQGSQGICHQYEVSNWNMLVFVFVLHWFLLSFNFNVMYLSTDIFIFSVDSVW